MKIAVRKTLIRGKLRWVVDRCESGKRKRQLFDTRKDADDEKTRLLDQINRTGSVWHEITASERSEMLGVLSEVKEKGLSIRHVWEAYKQGASTGIKQSRALAEAIEETLAAKKAAKRRPDYVDSLDLYLKKFAQGRESLSVDKITSGDIERWFVGRKEAPSSRASNLGRLSALFDLCYRRDYISNNPCDKVERVSIETGRPVIFSVEDSAKLIQTCFKTDKKLLPYIVLGLFCGLRPDECEHIKWSDIDFTKQRITIHESVSKVRHWRYVDMEKPAVAWLKLCKSKSLIPNPKTLRRRRRRLVERARLVWHQDILRKTAASFLMAIHRDAQKVSEMLGNSPAILRRHYRDLVSPEEAKKFFRILPK